MALQSDLRRIRYRLNSINENIEGIKHWNSLNDLEVSNLEKKELKLHFKVIKKILKNTNLYL